MGEIESNSIDWATIPPLEEGRSQGYFSPMLLNLSPQVSPNR
jgi:hypothetical protein